MDEAGERPATAVRFMHLGDQCPYTAWFRDEARQLAAELSLPFVDCDLTGKPDLAAADGAFHSLQVAVPGASLRTAPRSAASMRAELGAPAPVDVCPPGVLPPQAAVGAWQVLNPASPGWAEAVAATCKTCRGTACSGDQHALAVTAKRQWLESLPASAAGARCFLVLGGTKGALTGFAELVPLAAAHVPVPNPGPDDFYLTCVDSASGVAGDVRLALLEAATSVFGKLGGTRPSGAIWAVSGRALPYPNGPLALFTAAGFSEVASLGRHVLPGRCVDELVLLRWTPPTATDAYAVGVLVDPGDDVITIPGGADAGALVVARGLANPVMATQQIPAGHKLAIRDVPSGEIVRKYGQAIGRATKPIKIGEHVHVHNIASARAGGPAPATPVDGGDPRE